MGKFRYRRRAGKWRKSKRWGGQPSVARLRKEVADPRRDLKKSSFDFRLIALRLAKTDPRIKARPTSAKPFYPDCKAAIQAKRYFRSLGHIPLTPHTIVLLVERRNGTLLPPVLRVFSSPTGWRHF